MTAHSIAVACSMAVLVMGDIDQAAAFEDRPTADFDRTIAADGSVGDPVAAAATTDIDVGQHHDAIVRDRLGTRTAIGKYQARGEQPRPVFAPYAGIGIDKYKLSMDFENGKVALKKDKGFKRPRLILGMGYTVTEDLSLGFEYRALASNQPLFSLAVGSETLNVDTKFTTHNVFLKAKYKF